MRRMENAQGSSLGKQVWIRFSREAFDKLKEHLRQNPGVEQFAFGLFSRARTADGTVLIVQDLVLPEEGDLERQSAGCVMPTKRFQATTYLLAQQRGAGILDIHTHTHPGTPRFSGIDETESAKAAKYICEKLPPPVTQAMIVFGNNLAGHDAVVYDRVRQAHRNVDGIEVLGWHCEIRRTGESPLQSAAPDPQYDRQMRIPGWDQTTQSRQRVFVAGAGGNGSQLIQTLVSMGVGTEGWIAVADMDEIDASNPPRIPYAMPEHIGNPKVTVAAQFASRKNPAVRFYPYPCSVTEQAVVDRIKAATVIFGAGDGDGMRKFLNEQAVRYQIPYIDLGCDIQVDGDEVSSAGQVRVVIPGRNACLVCCQAFDPSAAALELMDDEQKAVHAARGYVIGDRTQVTASVANLNASIAQLGITAFLALVHGEQFGRWDYVHFNQLTANTLTATTHTNEACPLCGLEGILGHGDPVEPKNSGIQPPAKVLEKAS